MREKPILYDKSHPDYKDSRNKKRNHWQDVLDEFNKITAWRGIVSIIDSPPTHILYQIMHFHYFLNILQLTLS